MHLGNLSQIDLPNIWLLVLIERLNNRSKQQHFDKTKRFCRTVTNQSTCNRGRSLSIASLVVSNLPVWFSVPQRKFNKKLLRGQVNVERAFGIIKVRWGCLFKRLDNQIENVSAVLITCRVLQNFCQIYKVNYVNNDGVLENTPLGNTHLLFSHSQ